MSIRLLTRTGGEVSAMADSILNAASNVNGVLKGCEITITDGKITVAAGEILIEGRIVELPASESLTPTEAGILAMKIDLDAAPYVSLVAYPSGTSLTQEDIMADGKVYEQQLGTFSFSNGLAKSFYKTIGAARCRLNTAPANSRTDLGIYIQEAEPVSPQAGDLWFY